MFFVGTAPLSAGGHINISPKGMDTLRVVDADTIAYVDLVGSGAETIAHVRENERMTIMWCSFGRKPRIVRAYGRATHLTPGSPHFEGDTRSRVWRFDISCATRRLPHPFPDSLPNSRSITRPWP